MSLFRMMDTFAGQLVGDVIAIVKGEKKIQVRELTEEELHEREHARLRGLSVEEMKRQQAALHRELERRKSQPRSHLGDPLYHSVPEAVWEIPNATRSLKAVNVD